MKLPDFFKQYPRAALAFSGGVDSSYLLFAARQYGCDVHAYFVKSPFVPQFELEDAKRMARELGAPLTVLEFDILSVADVEKNDARRCYYCKRALFTLLKHTALKDGYQVLLDGTNASDDAADRPGMQALSELLVLSPLRICKVTKAQVRALSKYEGLFTHNKPAYACLATRIPTGRPITKELLERVEKSEDALFACGLQNFRVRVYHEAARVLLPKSQFQKAIERSERITGALSPYFEAVLLDLNPRQEE